MSKQLDCYYNDYVVFEGNLVEDLADEKHGEEVKTIITRQRSYINTVSNLTALESQANKTIAKLGDITIEANNAQAESDEFARALDDYKNGQCITDCSGNKHVNEDEGTYIASSNDCLLPEFCDRICEHTFVEASLVGR